MSSDSQSRVGAVGATAALRIDSLRFGWTPGTCLLNIPELVLNRNESLLLSGSSGSGKSTLLNLIGGVLTPDRGQISICGSDTAALGARQRDRFRSEHLGIIFQQFNLLPYLSVIDNVLLPLRFAPERRGNSGTTAAERRSRAQELLAALGLEHAAWSAPAYRLSVGQQQRTAAARALIGAPPLILADEPTSALDPDNRDRFIELLLAQAATAGSSVLLVSHDPSLIAQFDRSLALEQLNNTAAAT